MIKILTTVCHSQLQKITFKLSISYQITTLWPAIPGAGPKDGQMGRVLECSEQALPVIYMSNYNATHPLQMKAERWTNCKIGYTIYPHNFQKHFTLNKIGLMADNKYTCETLDTLSSWKYFADPSHLKKFDPGSLESKNRMYSAFFLILHPFPFFTGPNTNVSPRVSPPVLVPNTLDTWAVWLRFPGMVTLARTTTAALYKIMKYFFNMYICINTMSQSIVAYHVHETNSQTWYLEVDLLVVRNKFWYKMLIVTLEWQKNSCILTLPSIRLPKWAGKWLLTRLYQRIHTIREHWTIYYLWCLQTVVD